MAEPSAASSDGGPLRIPTNLHEAGALILSLLVIVLLVQLGAPLIRMVDFVDPKLKDYAIGVSFAAFPLIHRQCKRGLAGFSAQAPAHMDLTPWYVSGAIAAALLFAWNQFVSACAGFAIGILHAQIPVGQIDDTAFMQALGLSLLAVSIPMSAFASVFAGISLYRYTRSHVFAALATAAVLYLGFNLMLNLAVQPEFTYAQVASAAEGGVVGLIAFIVGMGLVAIVVLLFGGIGIAISRFNRERSLGRIVDGAQRLSPAERELLAAEVSRRLNPNQPSAGAPPPAASSFVGVAAAGSMPPPAPATAATAAEP